jgi:hypothetical protein
VKLKDVIRAVQQELPITPRMEAWLGANPNPVYSDRALQFAEQVLSQQVGGSAARAQPFRSSGVGLCVRRRLLSAAGVPEAGTIESKLANIFATGAFLHLKWQLAGLTEGWLAEAEVRVDAPHLYFGGTLDGLVYDGSGFEFKTKDIHIRQVHAYMMLQKIDAFSIVYEDKNTAEWREYRVHRDEKIIREIDRELGLLVESYVERKLPKMLHDCETKEGATYRSCPFKDSCPTFKKWPVVVK